jgi:hypothetical protein
MARQKSVPIPIKPEQSCGKNRYNSKQEAETIAREQELIFAHEDLKLKTYHCAHCGGWHLTRSVKDEHI